MTHPIKQLLEEKKITQKELAQKMNKPTATINYITNNYSVGTLDHAIEFAKTLGVKRTSFKVNGAKVSISFK